MTERAWLILIWTAVAILVVAIVLVLVVDTSARRKCTDNAGRVVEYNCTTTFVPTSCGSGCTMLIPYQSCQWRCEGANAEAR